MIKVKLGVVRGGALYVGALIGPGLLLIPALAVQAAGPASIIAWVGLLILSAPLAITFAALAVRYPVAGGVAAYVQAGLGDAAAAVTGAWFVAAIVVGGPAVSLIGGYYVADLTATGSEVAIAVAVAMFATVLATNALGLRVSSTVQLALSAILVGVLAVAITIALGRLDVAAWTPFAPHGWWAVGTAANILIWLFVGWEAVAQLVGDFRRPDVDLPRAMGLAFGVVSVLYVGLAVVTVTVNAGAASRVPLADLVAVGFGRVGRDVTAVLAVALTMGTMNVYMGGGAKLVGALAAAGAMPPWLRDRRRRTVPLRPLAVFALLGVLLLAALAGGLLNVNDLIRGTSSLFVGVYVLAIASAVRILHGRARLAALAAMVMVGAIALFSGWYAALPVGVAFLSLLQWTYSKSRLRSATISLLT